MKLPKPFRRKKRKKYPVMFDERGKSARSRCFEMFPDNIPLSEIADKLEIKIETVRRYHLQWKENPNFEIQYAYFKRLLKKNSPDRERTIELAAKACGITKEKFESILSEPRGLRQLMKGKLYLPGHSDADHKLYVVLEVAMTISDHLDKNGGKLEDVLFAIRRWMKENKSDREEEDEDIREENKDIAVMHRVLEAAAEQERQGRVQLDRLTEEERNAILWSAVKLKKKRTEAEYWANVALMMVDDKITRDQAREKMYQDLLTKGDIEGARMLRAFQDEVHPLKPGNQPPSPQPPPATKKAKTML
jgi:hypothetical protein